MSMCEISSKILQIVNFFLSPYYFEIFQSMFVSWFVYLYICLLIQNLSNISKYIGYLFMY